MNCPRCGTQCAADTRFCGNCGNDLSSIQQKNENNQDEVVEQLEEPVVSQTSSTPQSMATIAPMNEASTNNQQESEQPVIYNSQAINNEQSQNGLTPIAGVNNQSAFEVGQVQNINIQAPNEQMQSTNINGAPPTNNEPVLATQFNNQHKSGGSKTVFIILGVSLVVIIAALVGAFMLWPKSEEKKEKEKLENIFGTDQLIRVKEGDKYGYIDTDGKMVIEPKFELANNFNGDYALVRAEVEEEGLTRNRYQIINKKGEVKLQSDLSIDYIEEQQYWLVDYTLYDSSLKKLSKENVRVAEADEGYFIWTNAKDNTGGIMNSEGKQTYTYQFQNSESYINIEPSEIDDSLKERYCRVNIENDKYAIVNCDTGTVVYDFTNNYISVEDDNIFEISQKSTYENIAILYIQGDKIAYKSEISTVRLTYYPGYVQIRDGSKSWSERYTYFHTATGEVKTEKPSTTTESDSEPVDEWEKLTNNKKMSCSDGYGLTNNDTVTLPCEWDSIKYINVDLYKYLKNKGKDYVYAEKDDKWYLIDLPNKKAIVEFNTSYLTTYADSTFMYYTDQTSKTKKVYNLASGNTLNIENTSARLTVYSNYITVKDTTAKTLKYYNTELKLIYTEQL